MWKPGVISPSVNASVSEYSHCFARIEPLKVIGRALAKDLRGPSKVLVCREAFRIFVRFHDEADEGDPGGDVGSIDDSRAGADEFDG